MKSPDPVGGAEDEEQVALKAYSALYAKMQAVLDALEDFVAAESWADAKRVVETHQDELLTDAADDVLVTLMSRYKDAEVVRVLLQHRQVLMRCRVAGIDEAFAELVMPDDACPPGVDPALWQRVLQIDTGAALLDFLAEHPDLILHVQHRVMQVLDRDAIMLLEGLLALLGAATWGAAREIIEAVPALLSLEADIWLAQYAEALARQGDVEAVAVVVMRRWLLARCRMSGVDAAFLGWRALNDGVRITADLVSTPFWVRTAPAQAV
ncbi:MAG TPA: hypothetical protein PKZ84_06150 [Anaerolineae bacterium]|nr:hypothetical protein [Anaerolineae bacterium]HQI84033.1 hypothetical protein [Anaerolineae bacterium]